VSTVLALHGFSGGPESFDLVARALPRRVRLLAVPIAGHRRGPIETSTFEDEVERIARIASSLGGPIVLLGYSLGGRLGLAMLGRVPLTAAVIVSAHPGLVDPGEREARLADDARLAEALRIQGSSAFFDDWESLPLFATQTALDDATKRARAELRRAHDAFALASSLERLSLGAMPDTRPAISRFQGPIHFVAGARDSKFVALARESASLAPRGVVTVVDDVGHDVVLEAPDRIASIVSTLVGEAR